MLFSTSLLYSTLDHFPYLLLSTSLVSSKLSTIFRPGSSRHLFLALVDLSSVFRLQHYRLVSVLGLLYCSSVFDTIDHSLSSIDFHILSKFLNQFFLCGFSSCLTDRTQSVCVNSLYSSPSSLSPPFPLYSPFFLTVYSLHFLSILSSSSLYIPSTSSVSSLLLHCISPPLPPYPLFFFTVYPLHFLPILSSTSLYIPSTFYLSSLLPYCISPPLPLYPSFFLAVYPLHFLSILSSSSLYIPSTSSLSSLLPHCISPPLPLYPLFVYPLLFLSILSSSLLYIPPPPLLPPNPLFFHSPY